MAVRETLSLQATAAPYDRRALDAGSKLVVHCVFAPASDALACAAYGDVQNRQELRVYTLTGEFAPDGRTIAFGGHDNGDLTGVEQFFVVPRAGGVAARAITSGPGDKTVLG